MSPFCWGWRKESYQSNPSITLRDYTVQIYLFSDNQDLFLQFSTWILPSSLRTCNYISLSSWFLPFRQATPVKLSQPSCQTPEWFCFWTKHQSPHYSCSLSLFQSCSSTENKTLSLEMESTVPLKPKVLLIVTATISKLPSRHQVKPILFFFLSSSQPTEGQSPLQPPSWLT